MGFYTSLLFNYNEIAQTAIQILDFFGEYFNI